MKKLLAILLTVTSFISASNVFAGGSAIIPSYSLARYTPTAYYRTDFYISNVTSAPVDVVIKLYRNPVGSEIAPAIFTDSGNSPTSGHLGGSDFINYSELTQGASATFTINPYHTSSFYTYTYNTAESFPWTTGYGIIEWTSSDPNVTEALVANGNTSFLHNDILTFWTVPINGGKKF